MTGLGIRALRGCVVRPRRKRRVRGGDKGLAVLGLPLSPRSVLSVDGWRIGRHPEPRAGGARPLVRQIEKPDRSHGGLGRALH